jgi:hypothetical protein
MLDGTQVHYEANARLAADEVVLCVSSSAWLCPSNDQRGARRQVGRQVVRDAAGGPLGHPYTCMRCVSSAATSFRQVRYLKRHVRFAGVGGVVPDVICPTFAGV